MKVWSYWAGPKPPWIDTCLASIAHHCQQLDYRHLGPEDQFDPGLELDLHPKWLQLPAGVGTDCLRAALLAKHGGLWVDADTMMVRDPFYLFTNRHRQSEFLFQRWKDGRVIAGYCYSPRGHPIAKRWHAGVKASLEYADVIGWGDLGEKMLTPIVNTTRRDLWEMEPTTFMPIDIDQNVGRYFKRSGWKDFVTRHTIGFGLNYSWMMANHPKSMGSDEPLMINRLLADKGIL